MNNDATLPAATASTHLSTVPKSDSYRMNSKPDPHAIVEDQIFPPWKKEGDVPVTHMQVDHYVALSELTYRPFGTQDP